MSSCDISKHYVEEILDHDTTIDLTPFIKGAGVLCSQLKKADTANKVDDDSLKEIQRYLAAHLYTFRDQQYKSKKTADASATFQGTTGRGFESSHYGQMAKALDCTGFLSRRDRGVPEGGFGFTALGSEYSEANRNIHESDVN